MAYVPKELKAKIAKELKVILGTVAKKRGFQYSLKVRHHSTIVITIRKGTVDFIGNWMEKKADRDYHKPGDSDNTRPESLSVNTYSIPNNYTGEVCCILQTINECLNTDNHDNSDIMTDYFDVGHYVEINIGTWDKPYQLIK